ncbi:MAG: hypothetical protein OEY29_04200 [Gammaproteobacteria bacterium]|nr:hypothetical protein [Gammaproteobacteria bacterium]
MCLITVQAEPYGAQRELSRIRAEQSLLELDKTFHAVKRLMMSTVMTGDSEHDERSVEYFEQAFNKWKAYRSATCDSQTHLDVYPIESRLYMQTLNDCLWAMNKQYIEYLNNVSSGVISYIKQ